MSETNAHSSSTGHSLSEGKYLDVHFECKRHEYEETLRSVGIQPGWNVLDAGCGGGGFLPLMSKLVGESGIVEALDLAPENVNMVNEKATSGMFASPFNAKLGSTMELPYEDNQFDAVWCANVSQYLTDKELVKTLREMKRVTRPGGLIAFKEVDYSLHRVCGPLDPSLFHRMLHANRERLQIAGGIRTTSLNKWFRGEGLKDISYRSFFAERMHPLDEVSRAFIEIVLGAMGNLGSRSDVPDEDKGQWLRFTNKESPDYILNEPDFYWRAGWGLVIGSV